jgi:hypothetical protein
MKLSQKLTVLLFAVIAGFFCTQTLLYFGVAGRQPDLPLGELLLFLFFSTFGAPVLFYGLYRLCRKHFFPELSPEQIKPVSRPVFIVAGCITLAAISYGGVQGYQEGNKVATRERVRLEHQRKLDLAQKALQDTAKQKEDKETRRLASLTPAQLAAEEVENKRKRDLMAKEEARLAALKLATEKKAREAEAKAEALRLIALKKARKQQGVSIGMTKHEVYESSWGRPRKVNTTTNVNGTREQWVYDGGYLYFTGELLTSIQN